MAYTRTTVDLQSAAPAERALDAEAAFLHGSPIGESAFELGDESLEGASPAKLTHLMPPSPKATPAGPGCCQG